MCASLRTNSLILPASRAADHRLDAHGDMDTARGIHGRADRAHPVHEPAEILDALGPVENGRHEFAGHLVRFAGNGTVAVSPPRRPVEGGRDELLSVGRDGAPHRIADVIAADGDAARARHFGFKFNAEADVHRFNVLGFAQTTQTA